MEEKLQSLHRYFVWGNRMRTNMDTVIERQIKGEKDTTVEFNMYVSIWYGFLFVVIEGWNELNLSDKVIDTLLESKNVKLLKRYRNGVFHFQKNYWDERFTDLMTDGEDIAVWARTLNKEFGRFFLNEYRK